MQRGAVFMMGDNPALPRMPEKPTLLDFFRLRFGPVTRRHHCLSAKLALESGQSEKIVMACFLHDISNGALVRCDHGYWSSQLVAPYVDEEVAWAIRYHQPLRYFADESVGYKYPEAYRQYFGADYQPPEYMRRDHDIARAHRWYMSSRMITLFDIYAFEPGPELDFAHVRRRHRPQLPPAERRPGVRRIAGGAHVALDDLAQQLPVAGKPRAVTRAAGGA